MISRLGLAIITVVLAFTLLAPAAGAQVSILSSDTGVKVDTIRKARCRVSGKKDDRQFFLYAKSQQKKFRLTAFIDSPTFEGVHQRYNVYYGGKDPQIFLTRRADEMTFSNFKIPGTPVDTVGAGGIDFRRNGRLVGIGLYGASNRDFTEGFSFVGPLPCRYPHR